LRSPQKDLLLIDTQTDKGLFSQEFLPFSFHSLSSKFFLAQNFSPRTYQRHRHLTSKETTDTASYEIQLELSKNIKRQPLLLDLDNMTVISRSINTSHPDALTALKALAGVVGLDESSITFNSTPVASSEGSFSMEMKVSAKNSFNGNDVTYTASGFLECARVICNAVPESGLWVGVVADIESWVESASALITPAYVASDEDGKMILQRNSFRA
jgi:hypothetical protein